MLLRRTVFDGWRKILLQQKTQLRLDGSPIGAEIFCITSARETKKIENLFRRVERKHEDAGMD